MPTLTQNRGHSRARIRDTGFALGSARRYGRPPPTTAAISAHVTYLRALGTRGVLVVGGPFRDHTGAVVCVIAADEDAADAIARADPLVVFGFTLYQLHEIDRTVDHAIG